LKNLIVTCNIHFALCHYDFFSFYSEIDGRNQVFIDPITDIYHIIRDHRIKTNSVEIKYVNKTIKIVHSRTTSLIFFHRDILLIIINPNINQFFSSFLIIIYPRYDAILPQVLAKHTQQQLDNALQEYEKLNVWTVDTNKTYIIFNT
jgi:hypothetical protein